MIEGLFYCPEELVASANAPAINLPSTTGVMKMRRCKTAGTTLMKTNLSLAGRTALTIACALTSTVASAEERQGPYISGDLGVAMTQDTDLKEFPGAGPGHDVKFDTGMRLSVGGGWSFSEWFRAGGEFGFISHSLKGSDAIFYQMPLMGVVEFR